MTHTLADISLAIPAVAAVRSARADRATVPVTPPRRRWMTIKHHFRAQGAAPARPGVRTRLRRPERHPDRAGNDVIACGTYPVDIHDPKGRGTVLQRPPAGGAYASRCAADPPRHRRAARRRTPHLGQPRRALLLPRHADRHWRPSKPPESEPRSPPARTPRRYVAARDVQSVLVAQGANLGGAVS